MPKTPEQSAAATSDEPPRTRTQVRIVNLALRPDGGWRELTAEYKSSADAKKGQHALGAGTYQVAHMFGGPETLTCVQPDPVLVRSLGLGDGPPEPPAPEADDANA